MHLMVLESVDNDENAKKLGLTKERVKFAVESRNSDHPDLSPLRAICREEFRGAAARNDRR